VPFVDLKGLKAIACASKTTRDAAKAAKDGWLSWSNLLARDTMAVFKCWLAMGGKEDTLGGYRNEETNVWQMPVPPNRRNGVRVEGGRVTELFWMGDMIDPHDLTGTIPAVIGALDGLTDLNLQGNNICATCPRRSADSPPSPLLISALITTSKALSQLSSERSPPSNFSTLAIIASLGGSPPPSRTLPTSRTSSSTAATLTPTLGLGLYHHTTKRKSGVPGLAQ